MKGKSGSWRWIQTLALVWTVGLPLGMLVWVLSNTGVIEVKGFDIKKFIPQKGKGVVLSHNHPSWMEPIIIPALFFPWFLWDPYKVPLSAPDKRDYYDKWWWFLFRVLSIPVERGDASSNTSSKASALLNMLRKLRNGRVIAIAFEGGRTWKGEETFKEILPNGTIVERTRVEVVGVNGKVDLSRPIIRRLQKGAELLASRASFVPVWVTIKDRKIQIVVGDPFDSLPKEEITPRLERALLELAEE